jgi:ATP-binding cassette subfamily C (CFTR/MRP) protein 1
MDIVLICLGSDYIACTIPLALFAVYWIQKYYLRTSRQIRFLDLEAKSPLYKLFTETLEGVATIRGLGVQNAFQTGFLLDLDESQKALYIMMNIQRWLIFVLDCTVAGLAVVLVAIALCVPSSSSAGGLGVALTTMLSFNFSLQNLISNWTIAETSLGSVARTKSYEERTPNENSGGREGKPVSAWPRGKLEVRGLIVKYGDDSIALKDVNFTIEAGQKLGVCGRTGR